MNHTDRELAIRELRVAVQTRKPESIAHAAFWNVWPLYGAHPDELIAAVEALPGSVLDRYPVLRILHRKTPVLANTSRPFKPLISPEQARALSADEIEVLTLAQMIAFRLSGDVAAALIYARKLASGIRRTPLDSHRHPDGPLWYYHQQIGSTLLSAGDFSAALSEFATARGLGALSQVADAERRALGRAALAHAARGSFVDAEITLGEIAQGPDADPAHRAATTMTERTARALLDVERMTPDAGDVVHLLESYDSIEMTWPFALLARSRHLIAQRRPDEALEAVRLAGDAHPDQYGSFATDVITSISIEALLMSGATISPQSVPRSGSRSGQLTRIAVIRQALMESRWDAASDDIEKLARDPGLEPGPRTELLLLTAWLESAGGTPLTRRTVDQVARIAEQDGTRRMLSTMPAHLWERVHDGLPEADAVAFEAAITGLSPADQPRRPVLTTSELRLLSVLPMRATKAEMAAALFVSSHTVQSQLRSLYRKLGCSTREQAMSVAHRFRLIPLKRGARR